MTPVFADTFYFIALLNPDDEAHTQAVEFSKLIDRLVTTEWVLIELADGLATSPNRQLFLPTRTVLLGDDKAEVVPLSMEMQIEGISLYARRPDKEWSLTDCISFVVMKQQGLREALTGDHHFEQAGFVTLFK